MHLADNSLLAEFGFGVPKEAGARFTNAATTPIIVIGAKETGMRRPYLPTVGIIMAHPSEKSGATCADPVPVGIVMIGLSEQARAALAHSSAVAVIMDRGAKQTGAAGDFSFSHCHDPPIHRFDGALFLLDQLFQNRKGQAQHNQQNPQHKLPSHLVFLLPISYHGRIQKSRVFPPLCHNCAENTTRKQQITPGGTRIPPGVIDFISDNGSNSSAHASCPRTKGVRSDSFSPHPR